MVLNPSIFPFLRKEDFKIIAQNSDDNLVLSINIVQNSNGKSLFR